MTARQAAEELDRMAVNCAFFALGRPGAWRRALKQLWDDPWRRFSPDAAEEYFDT